jgi:MFS family permease
MSSHAESVDWPRPAVGWYAVTVLTIAYVLSFIDRSILTRLVAPIRADLGISDTQLSLLHGLAFAIFYTTLGIPVALLADRLNRRNIIMIGITMWSVATAVCGLARNFWQLFAARIAVGVGEATLSPAAYSMIADLFPPTRLGRALAVYTLGAFAGVGLAYVIGGAVIGAVSGAPQLTLPLVGEIRSWQLVFFVVGLPGALVALWMLTLPEPARRHASPAVPDRSWIAAALRECLVHMRAQWQSYAAHLAGFALLGLVFNAAIAWMPSYLIRVFLLAPAEAGFTVGIVLLVFGTLGVLTGGWLTDHLGALGHSDAAMRVGLIAAVCTLPLAASSTVVPHMILGVALFAGLMFFTSMPFGAAAAAIQLITPSRMRATASSIYLCVLNLVGLGLGPTLVALFTDFVFVDDAAVGRSLAVASILATVPAMLIFWWGLPHFRRAAVAPRLA